MKKFWFWSLATYAALLLACNTDPAESPVPLPDSMPSVPEHVVPVEAALADLESVLSSIDDPATRSGGSRRVGGVVTVKGSDVFPATRSEEAPQVDELVYIVNFENGEGYALLAADDRLDPVIAVTETGSLTKEDFIAVAQGEYDESEAPPVFPGVVNYIVGPGGGIGGGTGGGGGGIVPIYPGIDWGNIPPVDVTTRYGAWTTLLKKGPLLPMQWGQDAPYNKYLRNVGARYKVGCVAVALGQIIAVNYYNVYKNTDPSTIPIQYVGGKKIDWKTLFAEMEKYKNNIDRTYPTYTFASDAVAYFLWGVGIEAKTEYGFDVSSSNIDHAHHVLRYMGFQNVTKYYYYGSRAYEMIVDRGLPMYIRGFDRDRDVGHAWVLDGALKQERLVETLYSGKVHDSHMESRILYHANFGWAGECNGYYTENGVLEPRKKPLEREYYETDPYTEDYYFTKERRVLYYNLW